MKIKSTKSNFDHYKPAFNIEFIIEYDKEYEEEKLIKYIKNSGQHSGLQKESKK